MSGAVGLAEIVVELSGSGGVVRLELLHHRLQEAAVLQNAVDVVRSDHMFEGALGKGEQVAAVEEDLAAALDKGIVAGAAIDVFVEEPAKDGDFEVVDVVATQEIGFTDDRHDIREGSKLAELGKVT